MEGKSTTFPFCDGRNEDEKKNRMGPCEVEVLSLRGREKG